MSAATIAPVDHFSSTRFGFFSLSLAVHAAPPESLFLGQKIYSHADWLIVVRVTDEGPQSTCVAREISIEVILRRLVNFFMIHASVTRLKCTDKLISINKW